MSRAAALTDQQRITVFDSGADKACTMEVKIGTDTALRMVLRRLSWKYRRSELSWKCAAKRSRQSQKWHPSHEQLFERSSLNFLPENLLTYMLAWLPNRQKVLSSLDRTSPTSHKLQLAYCLAHWILLRLWTLVISGFLRALQPLGTNCRHRRRTVD